MKINVGSAEVKMMCVRLIMMVATTRHSHTWIISKLTLITHHHQGGHKIHLTMFDVQYQEHWGGMGTCWFT